MEERTRVVILGGGFGGLVVARRLARSHRAGRLLDVTVVDENATHVYTPWLYELATSCLTQASDAREWKAARRALNISFGSLRGFDSVRFRRGRVASVDHAAHHVVLEDGMTIPYDVLVIALGAKTNGFGIVGLRERSIPLKSLGDGFAIRRVVMEKLRSRPRGSHALHVVVGGAGPNGTEFAAELMAAARASVRRGYLDHDALDVTLIDAAPDVLVASSPRIRTCARRRLERLGVRVHVGVSLSALADDHAVVAPTPIAGVAAPERASEQLPCDLCVWSGGVTMSDVVRTMSFPKDAKGRIQVDACLRVHGETSVYALGDCASSMNPFTNAPDPQTAEVAVDQAGYVAKNIMRAIAGREGIPFPYPESWSMLITLGGKYAVGNVFGVNVCGYVAYLLRRLVDLRYFLTILSPADALRFWWRGVDVYAKNETGE